MTRRLTIEDWVAMAKADERGGEEVVLMARLKDRHTLYVTKQKMKAGFRGSAGVKLAEGECVEVLPSPTGTPKLNIPASVARRLGLTPGCRVCMTRVGKDVPLFLKRFELQKGESELPGSVVVDTFSKVAVERIHYAGPMSLGACDLDGVPRMVERMGRLAHDPMQALPRVEGRAGYLLRRLFGGPESGRDSRFAAECASHILGEQDRDGGWDRSLVATAFNLIRLMEVGLTIVDKQVAKAARWLLDSPELAGVPGLFAATTGLGEEFNRNRADGNDGHVMWDNLCHYFVPKEGLSRKYQPIRDTYDANRDVVPGICELGVASASAVILQALLRLGFAEHRRVRQAINTMLAAWDRIWCGHRFYRPDGSPAPSAAPPDFDTRFDPRREWPERAKVGQMTPPPFGSWRVGEDCAIVEANNLGGAGGCSLAIYAALSWHPGFAGSRLEAVAALGYAARQSSRGRWQPPRATMLHNLVRLTHPLAALLVARTVPQLIRDQQDDGLWPEGDTASFEILRALSNFGLLESLLPVR